MKNNLGIFAFLLLIVFALKIDEKRAEKQLYQNWENYDRGVQVGRRLVLDSLSEAKLIKMYREEDSLDLAERLYNIRFSQQLQKKK